MNLRRILALIGVLLLLSLYIASLILGIIGSPRALELLMAALFCTIVVPAVLYGYGIFLNGTKNKNRHMADNLNKEQLKDSDKF